MPTTDIRVALTGVLLVLALAGCSAPAPDAESAAHASDAAEGAVVYPVAFPTDAVPMFDGPLLHIAHPGNLWAAWIASDDLPGDLASATALLVNAGYTVTSAADGYAEFADDKRSLRIVASVDASYGSCLAYTITDGAPGPEEGSGGSED